MFTHDTEHSLLTIVDLVNTDPAYNGTEGLPDIAALQEFVGTHLISHASRLTAEDVTAVRATRGAFARLFGLSDAAHAAELVNTLVADATVQPRLTDHDGYGWHLHYFAPEATLAEHLLVDGGMALAHVVTADEIDRLRTCAAPTCQAVLIDLSRNSSKRYCDASTCGNRLHVAAYRERKKSQQLLRRA
jgi:predicted RNA-binding Zn ribbon-like protein